MCTRSVGSTGGAAPAERPSCPPICCCMLAEARVRMLWSTVGSRPGATPGSGGEESSGWDADRTGDRVVRPLAGG
eukprot:CAMPEP_0118968240 /NCGR_PEP_ID=MMETSP1173-20130426/5500_1 /TAXON_ID=1034831 /ORGANISM="Rhizochromulina marina cf, Strain CCMP1243" /LENGTH=74 /DNA_ID=CAMNT_0006917323 /DNA_START=28 /DNA_END=248 /DNA_ORIENTATION=-